MTDSCVFCRIVDGQLPAQVVWQSEAVWVIKDRQPKAAHHLLVIPTVHIVDVVQAVEYPDVLVQMMQAVATVARTVQGMSQFRLISNTGAAAGQSVFHVHMHMIAGAGLPPF